jgi:Fur family ferric uptake transcriptional regulator
MTHHLLNYPGRIRRSGHRVTPQREAILDAICAAGRRVSVEEILLWLRRNHPTLNRATVYRNLTFLQKLKLVNAVGNGKARRFEIASVQPHHHLVCRVCGAEIHLDEKYVSRLRESVKRDFRFAIDEEPLSFQGVCRACRTAARGFSSSEAIQRNGRCPGRKNASE